MTVRLKYVYIDNFKSFKDCFVPLDKFNILVAPNNGGKSNFIHALEFIQSVFTKGVGNAIDEFGGIETIKNYRNKGNSIKFGFHILRKKGGRVSIHLKKQSIVHNILSFKDLETLVNLTINTEGEDRFLVEYDLTYEGKVAFVQEKEKSLKNFEEIDEIIKKMENKRHYSFKFNIKLTQKLPLEDEDIYTSPKYEFQYSYAGRKEHKNKIADFVGIAKQIKISPENEKIAISDFPDLEISRFFDSFPIRTYYFSAHSIKFPKPYRSGIKLNKEGTNISSVLKFLKEKRSQVYERISNSLIGIVDELEGIDVGKDEFGRDKIFFLERLIDKKERKVPIDIVSDGTVNLVATLTALFEPYPKLLLSIEEPERHLHPKAIEYLLLKMRSSVQQILITTQSSEILRNIDLKNDNLILLFRDIQGNTKAISHREIANFERKVKRSGFDIAEFIKNEELGYLGDYLYEKEEDKEKT